jgi:hypothetical protein
MDLADAGRPEESPGPGEETDDVSEEPDTKPEPEEPAREPGDEPESQPDEVVVKDDEGLEVPPQAAPAFEARPRFREWLGKMAGLYSEFVELQDGPGGRLIHLDSIQQQFGSIKSEVVANLPSHVCPYCMGKQTMPPCRCCHNEGWTNKTYWKTATF